jgi:hypothetical protein
MLRVSSSKYLASDERVVIDVRKHWTVLASPMLEMVGVLLAAAIIGTLASPNSDSDFLDTFLGLVSVVFVLRFFYKLWEWFVNRIVVTNQRFIEASGVITRSVASMPLLKVTDLTYRRTLAGRLFGYGDLILESAGQRQALDRIEHLPHPNDFYRTVTSLLASRLSLPIVPGGTPTPAPYEQQSEDTDEDDTGPLPRVIV